MNDGDALLAAIRARPDDDTPRLVYADWLDDLQTPAETARAEWIRVQIAVVRPVEGCKESRPCLPLNRGVDIGRWCPACWPHRGLLRRDDELYAEVGTHFLPAGIGSVQVTWRRGFVEECEVTAEVWLQHGDAIVKAHPVRRVGLTTLPPAVAQYHPRTREYTFRLEWDRPTPEVTRGEASIADANGMRAIEREVIAELLETAWPGVAFNLPRAGEPDYRTFLESMDRDIMRGLSLPPRVIRF